MAVDDGRGHLSPLFTWRSAICQSELPATTRHVALTLSLHMSELGDSCYPSQSRLAEETGLARRTVNRHLSKLDGDGWLEHTGWKTWETPGGEQKTKVWKAVLPRSCQRITPLAEGCGSEAEGCDPDSERVGQRITQGRHEDDRGRRGRTPARGNSRSSGPGDVRPANVDCPDCDEALRVKAGGLYCIACADWKRPAGGSS